MMGQKDKDKDNTLHEIVDSITERYLNEWDYDSLRSFAYDRLYDEVMKEFKLLIRQ
jgi:hypothetical protein